MFLVYFVVAEFLAGFVARPLADMLAREREQARRHRPQRRQPPRQWWQARDWRFWALVGLSAAAVINALVAFALVTLITGPGGLILMGVAFALGWAMPELSRSRHFARVVTAIALLAAFVLIPELRAPLMSLALLCGILVFLVRGTLFPTKKKS